MMKTILIILLVSITICTNIGLSEISQNQAIKITPIIDDIENMDINNIDLQLVNNGRTGNDGHAFYPTGTNLGFLFDGGFAASGYVSNDLRLSWLVSDVLVFEWQQGKWGMMPNDTLARFYVVNQSDDFGSPAYINWADAVSVGASFQDLNGDGLYDPFVDRPDIWGERTIWTPFNDGTPDSVRNQGFFRTAPA